VTAMSAQKNRRPSSTQTRRPPERTVPGVEVHAEANGPLAGLDAERQRNRRWPLAASVVSGIVVGVIFSVIGIPMSIGIGIAVGVLTAVLAGFMVRRGAPAATVRNIGAAPVEPGALPRVETLLIGLSATMGVATPAIGVLVDEVPNACVIGTRATPTVVVTTGLVNALSVVELEGVLSHLLAQQRLEAVERGTFGAGLALLLGGIGRRGSLAHRLTGTGRLYRADELAALTVRYPLGLAAALRKMEQAALPEKGSLFASPVYATIRWLFVDPSIARRAKTDEIGDIDATGVRRHVLEER